MASLILLSMLLLPIVGLAAPRHLLGFFFGLMALFSGILWLDGHVTP